MKQRKTSQIAKSTALISFVIGTLIFLGYQLTTLSTLVSIGFIYVIIAFITNSLLLFFVFIELFFADLTEKIQLLKTLFIMLLNIPIVFIYLSFISI